MPQVPYSPVPDVSPSFQAPPRLNVSTPPAAFGATVAAAIEHLGTTEEQVGNELSNRALALQQLRNDASATAAIAKQEKDSNDLHVKFSALEGKNAVDGYQKYSDDQDQLRQDIRGTLPNAETQRIFDRSSLFIMNRALFNGAGHAATEQKKYSNDAANSRIQSLQDAAKYSIDDKDFQNIQGQIREQSDFISNLAGHDDVSKAQFAFKNQSGALASRIIETAHKDPVEANKMFNKAVEDHALHSTDYDRVDRVVRSELYTTGARSVSHSVMREIADPEGFLARRGPGARVAGLNPEFASRLQAAIFDAEKATGEQAQIESLARTNQEQREIYERHLNMPGGVAMHPAAPPGTSRHEFGEAADLKDGKVLDWLHQNAGKYGLEFLQGETGKHDPGHIQLSGGTPERRLSPYEIPEQQIVDQARQKAEMQAPGNVDFADSAVRQTLGLYRQNIAIAQQDRKNNNATVWNEIGGDNPPATLDDLRSRSPEVGSAYERLDGKDKLAVERAIASRGRVASDLTEVQRLNGMTSHKEGIADFLGEDIVNNNKLSTADKRKFMTQQAKLTQQSEADPRVSYAMGPNGIGPIIPSDIRSDKDEMNILRGAMQDQIQLYQQVYKTFPDTKTLQEMGQRIFMDQQNARKVEGKYTGFQPMFDPFGAAHPIYGLYGGDESLLRQSVPSADRERIRTDPRWTERNLPPPDDNEVRRIYIGEQYQRLYGKPEKEHVPVSK